MSKNLTIVRKQLDSRFQKLRVQGLIARPQNGWIKTIRNSLGMSARQLAVRLGVSQPRVAVLEKDEIKSKLTLETLEKTATALNCTLVYLLLPNQSLEQIVYERAERIAEDRLKTVGHTMDLENQRVSFEDSKEHHKKLVEDIIQHEVRHLWDEV